MKKEPQLHRQETTPCTEEKGQEQTKKRQPGKNHHRQTPGKENDGKVHHRHSALEDSDTQTGVRNHQGHPELSTEGTRRTKARPIGTGQDRTRTPNDHRQTTEEKEALVAQLPNDQPDEERHEDQAQEKKEDGRREDQTQEKTEEKTDAAKTEDQAEKDATATEATAATEKKGEMMTEDQEEKEPETPTTDPATTQVPKMKKETEGDAMMTEEDEIKGEGIEEADQDPTAETVSAKKGRQGTTKTTRASTNPARIQASSPKNLKPTPPQSNSKDGRNNSTLTG